MNLGRWLNNQRVRKKKGALDSSLEKRLEDIGVAWDVLSEQWENNYRSLINFQQRGGHCYVPYSHKEDGMNLGAWLSDQKIGRRRGKLDGSLEKQLGNIGVVWDARSEQWEDTYRLLVKFQQREGHCNVPQNYKEDEMNLGNWLKHQRKRIWTENLTLALKNDWKILVFSGMLAQNNGRIIIGFLSSFNNGKDIVMLHKVTKRMERILVIGYTHNEIKGKKENLMVVLENDWKILVLCGIFHKNIQTSDTKREREQRIITAKSAFNLSGKEQRMAAVQTKLISIVPFI